MTWSEPGEDEQHPAAPSRASISQKRIVVLLLDPPEALLAGSGAVSWTCCIPVLDYMSFGTILRSRTPALARIPGRVFASSVVVNAVKTRWNEGQWAFVGIPLLDQVQADPPDTSWSPMPDRGQAGMPSGQALHAAGWDAQSLFAHLWVVYLSAGPSWGTEDVESVSTISCPSRGHCCHGEARSFKRRHWTLMSARGNPACEELWSYQCIRCRTQTGAGPCRAHACGSNPSKDSKRRGWNIEAQLDRGSGALGIDL